METVSVWEDAKILEVDVGDSCTAIRMYLVPVTCALKNGEDQICYVYFITRNILIKK